MSDDLNNPNRPPDANDTDETPALPEPGAAELSLAKSLRELAPAPPAINRDRLMFAAGSQSSLNALRLWQFAAGILAAVGFAAGMYFKPPVIVVRDVYVAPSQPTPFVPQPATPNDVPPPAPVVPAVVESEPSPEVQPSVPVRTFGDSYHWLQVREDVLNGGLGALPDAGRQSSPPRNVAVNQPGALPRGTYGDK